MENKDSEATRASPDATTVQIVTGPTLRAPELEMIGITEASPMPEAAPEPPAPEAVLSVEAPPAPAFAPLLETPEQQAAYWQGIANAACQPQQKAQQESQQAKEKEIPTPAAFLFATSTATLSLSKDAIIALVLLFIALAVIGGGVYLCCHSGGHAGGPATA